MTVSCPFCLCRGRLNSLLPDQLDFGPNLNFIGLKTQDYVRAGALGWMLETPPKLVPADLYSAMKLSRPTRLAQAASVQQPLGVCTPRRRFYFL